MKANSKPTRKHRVNLTLEKKAVAEGMILAKSANRSFSNFLETLIESAIHESKKEKVGA